MNKKMGAESRWAAKTYLGGTPQKTRRFARNSPLGRKQLRSGQAMRSYALVRLPGYETGRPEASRGPGRFLSGDFT